MTTEKLLSKYLRAVFDKHSEVFTYDSLNGHPINLEAVAEHNYDKVINELVNFILEATNEWRN